MKESRPTMNDLERMDRRITSALEYRPPVAVPEGFAARVVQALPARSAHRSVFVRLSGSAGKATAMAAAVLLAGTLFVLAPHAGPSFTNVAFDAELLVLAELAAVAYGLARMLGGRL